MPIKHKLKDRRKWWILFSKPFSFTREIQLPPVFRETADFMTQSGRGVFSWKKVVFFLDEMESFSRDCRFYSPVWMRWWVKVTSANTMSGPWTRKGKFANQTQVFEILVKFEIRLKALEENANLNIFVWIYSVMICCKLECRFWSHQCKSTNEQMAQHKQNASEYIIICTKSQKP